MTIRRHPGEEGRNLTMDSKLSTASAVTLPLHGEVANVEPKCDHHNRRIVLGLAFIKPSHAGPVAVDAIPIDDLVGIVGIAGTGGYDSFDPSTHIFRISETIVAVQFPNQVLS